MITVYADQATMTGITSNDQHVYFCRSRWAWCDTDNGEPVVDRYSPITVIWVDTEE